MRLAALLLLVGCDGVFGLYPISPNSDGGGSGDGGSGDAAMIDAPPPPCMTTPFSTATTHAVEAAPVGIALGDLDQDADVDIVVANSMSASFSVLLNNGTGDFPVMVAYPLNLTPTRIKVALINTDSNLDVVASSTSGINVVPGVGDGTFTMRTVVQTTTPLDIAVGNIDADPAPDLVYTISNSAIPLFNMNGVFFAGQTYGTGGSPGDVTIAPLDGDNVNDVVTANNTGNTISVLDGNGDGTFDGADTYGSGAEPRMVVAGRFNSDTLLDLAVVVAAGGEVRPWLANGTGGFMLGTTVPVPGNPGGIAAGDLDGDGDTDLVVTKPIGVMNVLTNNGSGMFTVGSPISTGTSPGEVEIADVDRDGFNDIIVVNRGSNNVSVYLGCPPQ